MEKELDVTNFRWNNFNISKSHARRVNLNRDLLFLRASRIILLWILSLLGVWLWSSSLLRLNLISASVPLAASNKHKRIRKALSGELSFALLAALHCFPRRNLKFWIFFAMAEATLHEYRTRTWSNFLFSWKLLPDWESQDVWIETSVVTFIRGCPNGIHIPRCRLTIDRLYLLNRVSSLLERFQWF